MLSAGFKDLPFPPRRNSPRCFFGTRAPCPCKVEEPEMMLPEAERSSTRLRLEKRRGVNARVCQHCAAAPRVFAKCVLI